ncbi:hypothetical protein SLUN_19045 [Streptomyces lunaelactis]|uniref:DUF2631 domain-containing protein n=1 Tax=Streptomyces lunaelactis TaxID=1535768 RepID=A0A2R4T4D4_9ACTN|nr:hypothetical protein [Streptomyces lunaelactis]AVZ73951.1 hypothetical protein SLUN_19045 [Streptomyces lunaelactis]NUK86583.1 hypothetical protein [Streptomyces lunaelactis]
MASTDPYRLTTHTESPHAASPGVTGADVLRTLLWLVLVISAIGNSVASYGGATTRIHLAFGTVTALCVVALLAQRLRGRRR